MPSQKEEQPARLASEQIVLDFLNALNKEEYVEARNMISDDFQFEGALGKRSGGDVYMNDMKKMKFKYSVKMVFVNGDDIGVLLDFTVSGKTLTSFGWYHVENDRIKFLRVIFDPRPLLDGAPGN